MIKGSQKGLQQSEFEDLKRQILDVTDTNPTCNQLDLLAQKLTPEKLRLREISGNNLLYYVIYVADLRHPQLLTEIWHKHHRGLTLQDFRAQAKGKVRSPLWLFTTLARIYPVIYKEFIEYFKNDFTADDYNDEVTVANKSTNVLGMLCDFAVTQPEPFKILWENLKRNLTTEMLTLPSEPFNSLSSKKTPFESLITAVFMGQIEPSILQYCIEQFGDLRKGLSPIALSQLHFDFNHSYVAQAYSVNLNNLQQYKNAFFDALDAQNDTHQHFDNITSLAQSAHHAGFHSAYYYLAYYFLGKGHIELSDQVMEKVSLRSIHFEELLYEKVRTLCKGVLADQSNRVQFLTEALQFARQIPSQRLRYKVYLEIANTYLLNHQNGAHQFSLPLDLLEAIDLNPPPQWCFSKFDIVKTQYNGRFLTNAQATGYFPSGFGLQVIKPLPIIVSKGELIPQSPEQFIFPRPVENEESKQAAPPFQARSSIVGSPRERRNVPPSPTTPKRNSVKRSCPRSPAKKTLK
jgi:hypothetical protein